MRAISRDMSHRVRVYPVHRKIKNHGEDGADETLLLFDPGPWNGRERGLLATVGPKKIAVYQFLITS